MSARSWQWGVGMRVALFGCGWVQDFHARAVLAHGDELVAVANHREPSAANFAERHGIARVTTDWEALARDHEVDAAIVATPNALHAPQSIALLDAGKPVLVEKPMATSVSACDAMIAASRSSGRRAHGRSLLAVPAGSDRCARPHRGTASSVTS